MFNTIREYLEIVRPEGNGSVVNAPDYVNWNNSELVPYTLQFGFHLHHGDHPQFPETVSLPDGGCFQASIMVVKDRFDELHAFVHLIIDDHEACTKEYILLDELLECGSWEEFRDCLYSVKFDADIDLTIERVDTVMAIMPDWFGVQV